METSHQPFRNTYGIAVWLATPITPRWGLRCVVSFIHALDCRMEKLSLLSKLSSLYLLWLFFRETTMTTVTTSFQVCDVLEVLIIFFFDFFIILRPEADHRMYKKHRFHRWNRQKWPRIVWKGKDINYYNWSFPPYMEGEATKPPSGLDRGSQPYSNAVGIAKWLVECCRKKSMPLGMR